VLSSSVSTVESKYFCIADIKKARSLWFIIVLNKNSPPVPVMREFLASE
jgi:hypothetical protein